MTPVARPGRVRLPEWEPAPSEARRARRILAAVHPVQPPPGSGPGLPGVLRGRGPPASSVTGPSSNASPLDLAHGDAASRSLRTSDVRPVQLRLARVEMAIGRRVANLMSRQSRAVGRRVRPVRVSRGYSGRGACSPRPRSGRGSVARGLAGPDDDRDCRAGDGARTTRLGLKIPRIPQAASILMSSPDPLVIPPCAHTCLAASSSLRPALAGLRPARTGTIAFKAVDDQKAVAERYPPRADRVQYNSSRSGNSSSAGSGFTT